MQPRRDSLKSTTAETRVAVSPHTWQSRRESLDTVASVVSAFAALAGTIVAARAISAQVRLQRLSNRQQNYQQLIVAPTIADWANCIEQLHTLVKAQEKLFADLHKANAPVNSLRGAADNAMVLYNDFIADVEQRLTVRLTAWGDDSLTSKVETQLLEAQDLYAKVIEALRTNGTAGEVDVNAVLGSSTRVLSEIIHFDCK
jgi:hypothetical protein